MERRQFVKSAAVTVGALASGLGVSRSASAESTPAVEPPPRTNRLVHAVSVGFASEPGLPLEKITALVDQHGAQGVDILSLPETCRGYRDEKDVETLDGPTVTAVSRLAQKYRMYIVCPISRRDGSRRFNTAVLLDRQGKVACMYDKLYPVWQSECDAYHIQPGDAACVHETDFGRVGLAICFDVNWNPLWERMADLGAELVIWPSAYAAGRSLQARAIQYNYYIMSSTLMADCLVYDIDGELITHDRENAGSGVNVTHTTFDLDRCIFHTDLNVPKRDALLRDHGDDVVLDKDCSLENWFVLKAKRPGVSARELAGKYGLEELQHYINRSRCEIDKCRGFTFA